MVLFKLEMIQANNKLFYIYTSLFYITMINRINNVFLQFSGSCQAHLDSRSDDSTVGRTEFVHGEVWTRPVVFSRAGEHLIWLI